MATRAQVTTGRRTRDASAQLPKNPGAGPALRAPADADRSQEQLGTRISRYVRRILSPGVRLLAATQTVVLHQAADNTSAILTFIGVIAVALLAAATAQWRLHIQLKHEGDRHRQQLDHDRELKDLDEVRALVDEATAHLHEASVLWISVRSVAKRTSVDPDTLQQRLDEWEEPFAAMVNDSTRLNNRGMLKAGHALTGVYLGFDHYAAEEAVTKLRRGEDASSELARVQASEETLRERREAFYDEARRIAGLKLPSPDGS